MESLPSLRMTANLNALTHARLDPLKAAAAIRGADVAHHVLDPESVLGLDPLSATDLEAALPVLSAAERTGWSLGLPVPGALLPLRGPRQLNEAALVAGEVVLARSAGVGLIPLTVGRGVQWRLYRAEVPQPPPSPYEAERALSEAVLAAAHTLTQLDVAAGTRPRGDVGISLAPGYSQRQLTTASRARYLLAACDAALADDGASISSFEASARAQTLRQVRAAASQALCTAYSWMEEPQ